MSRACCARSTIVLAIAISVTSGCESVSSTAGDHARLIEPGALPVVRLVESTRLGGAEAPEQEIFSPIPLVEVDSDGTVFVLERSADEVRRFAADGTFLNVIGRAGQGPGELTSATGLGLVGDTVWIRNFAPASLSFYTPEGEHIRTDRPSTWSLTSEGPPIVPDAILQEGRWIVRIPVSGPVQGRADIPLLFGSSSGGRGTLAMVSSPPGLSIPNVGTFSTIRGHPLPPLYDVRPGGSGVLVADWRGEGLPDGAFRLRRYLPDGTVDLDATLRFPPVHLDARVADSLVSAAADSVRAVIDRVPEPGIRERVPTDLEDVVREELALGTAFPPIRALVSGLDGSIWVERVLGPSAAEWVGLDEEGGPLLRFSLPDEAHLVAASRRTAWTVETDVLEVPYIVSYDLMEGSGGG